MNAFEALLADTPPPYWRWKMDDGPSFADTGTDTAHPAMSGTSGTAYGQSGLFTSQSCAQILGSGSDAITGSLGAPTATGGHWLWVKQSGSSNNTGWVGK